VTVQAHAEEVNFVFLEEAFGRSEEQVILSEDLEEFNDNLAM